jgi:hypothetical protein
MRRIHHQFERVMTTIREMQERFMRIQAPDVGIAIDRERSAHRALENASSGGAIAPDGQREAVPMPQPPAGIDIRQLGVACVKRASANMK